MQHLLARKKMTTSAKRNHVVTFVQHELLKRGPALNAAHIHNVSTMQHLKTDTDNRTGLELQAAAAARCRPSPSWGSASDLRLRTPKALWVIIDLLPGATKPQHTAQPQER